MRYDLHVHTCYSYDCGLSLEALSRAVARHGLDGLAVLDHDEIAGALKLQAQAPFQVIVGEEIGTADGGLAGMFLNERIPSGLSAAETAARIHAQGGLVLVPHPLSRGVPGRLGERKLREIVAQVDLVEGYNARAFPEADDRRAREVAAEYGLPVTAGSDAHFALEMGHAWTEMALFHDAGSFMRSVTHARLVYGRKTPVWVPALTIAGIPFRTIWRRTAGRPSPGAAKSF